MTATAADELTAILGDAPGWAALAFGRGGARDENGRYRHGEWTETTYAWPAEAEALRTDLAREAALGEADVYVCPLVRAQPRRRKGEAAAPAVCWADLDGPPADAMLYLRLSGYAVASGSHGHRHYYVPLTEPVDVATHAKLNRGLAAALGGDAKWSDESLLRVPGTVNRKSDPPEPVIAEGSFAAARAWAPAELAELLGVDLTATAEPSAAVDLAEAEPVDEPLPMRVQRALAHPETSDRSVAHARLVGACYDAGLRHGQALSVVAGYPPSVEKYGERLGEEVARFWGKASLDRDQPEPLTPLEPGGSVYDPETFFDRINGLKVATLAEAVEDAGPLATDEAGRLYRYSGGAWLGDGERIATARVVAATGNRYRRAHATNTLDVLRSREPLFTEDGLDTRFLNLPNGLLDWKTGQLHPHSPAVPNLSRLPISWHPGARCPVIDSWLAETFPDDALGFVDEVLGYALYNGNPLHIAILLSGRGRNGKGTLLRLMEQITGVGNVSSVTPQALDEDRFRAAELHGKLANLVGDVDPKTFRSTETFKQITGGDRITTERKYGQPFSFVCRALMVAAFNSLPRTTDTSEGFFSRWLVVPFPRRFSRAQIDRSLEPRMHTTGELQGLLVRAVAGLQRLMRRGHFAPPESVEAATRDFRETADPVRGFLAEAVEVDRHGWFPRSSLYSEWQSWAEEHGHYPGSAAQFYERAEAAATESIGGPLEPRKREGVRGFVGARITRERGQW